jgi:hypothetical protein
MRVLVEPQILLGEPVFRVDPDDQKLIAPIGQYLLCQQVRDETQDEDKIYGILREEYLAIAHALHVRMGIDFRIVYAHKEVADKQTLGVLINISCRLVGFPPVLPRLTSFPRDFVLDLPGICLLSPNFGELTTNRPKGRRAIVSPYGEGGRILAQGDVALVGDKICRGSYSEPPQTKPLEEAGIKVGVIPNFVSVEMSEDPGFGLFSTNDHLDRVACLLRGPGQRLHLVVDPLFHSGPAAHPTPPKTSINKIRDVCAPLGIDVHVPEAIHVPYSLNLVQFRDGRVLMSGGDFPVAEVVAQIVGPDKLFLTEVPIRYYPAWTLAGIHCLVGEAPSVFFRPRQEGEPIAG